MHIASRKRLSQHQAEIEMAYINVSPALDDIGNAISTIGTDHVYVALNMRWLGERIELTATAVSYNSYSGAYLRDELGVEIVDVEEAIDAATDLQHLAHLHLDANGQGRGYSSPRGFGEAVELALDAAERQEELTNVPEHAGVTWPAAAE
jgi:hypothetical protein